MCRSITWVCTDGPLLAWLKREWPKRATVKLDLGKCCLRFKKLDQIPYELIGELAAKMPPAEWIATYQSVVDHRAKRASARGTEGRKTSRTKGPRR